jgi:hypothetical protein
MKKVYLTFLFVQLLILSACASIEPSACPDVSTTLTAKDSVVHGNDERGPTFIRVKPDTVKVKKGCNFVINNPRGRSIHTTSTETWLKSNETNGDITLGPAASTNGEDVFKYTIHVKGVGRLDPRARVTQ